MAEEIVVIVEPPLPEVVVEFAELAFPGPRGEKGEKGEKGDTGPRGLQGEQGVKGDQGEVGMQGVKGDQGIQGLKGDRGDQGPRGLTGSQGDDGPMGPQGDRGDTGPRGLRGATGPQGDPGPEGPRGPRGFTGEQGTQGVQGEKGDPGTTSWDGITDRPDLSIYAPTTYVDAGDTASRQRANHIGTQSTASIDGLREYIEDTIGGMLRAVGADLDISYDDQSGNLTIDYTGSPNDPEAIRDAIGAAMVGLGNINVLVNDEANTITIVTSATVNAPDAELRDRATHTGNQLAETISDLSSAVHALMDPSISAEVTARINSDTALGSRIDGEVTARINSDTALGSRIDGEVTARVNADDALSTRIQTNTDTLAAATSAATPDTIVRRNSTAGIGVNFVTISNTSPTSASHATRKDYVDSYGSATNLNTNATTSGGSVDLSGWSIPFTSVRTLTSNVTVTALPNAIALGSARSGVGTAIFVQAASGTGPFTITWPATGITWLSGAAPVMPTTAGARLVVRFIWTGSELLGSADEADLANASSGNAANNLVRRDANGWSYFARAFAVNSPPTSVGELTRKDYVDSAVLNGDSGVVSNNTATAGTQTVSASWLGSIRVWTLSGNLTVALNATNPSAGLTGTVSMLLIQATTGGPFTITWPATGVTWLTAVPTMPTTAGARLLVRFYWTGTEWLGLAVEADLANATAAVSPSTLMRRDTNSNAFLNRLYISGSPTGVNEATRKDYVDTYGSQAPASNGGSWTGSFPLSFSNPQVQTRTLTANVTLTSINSPASAASFTVSLVLIQAASGTGPFTVTWPSTGIRWANGNAPVMPTNASARLLVHLMWTGAEWLGMVGGVFY